MRTILSAVIVVVLQLTPPMLAQERARTPQGGPGTVTLSLAEYDRLLDRASKPGIRPDPPPLPAVVSRSEFTARVNAGVVRGTLRLEGEVFSNGVAKIPLVAGATVFEARSDGRPLPVMHEGESHVAVIAGPAPFSATLDWGVALDLLPGRASFTIPAAQAGSVSATIDLPGDPADVRVEPGLITRRQAVAGRTQVEVTLKPGQRSFVSWAMRETAPQVAAVEARMLADIKSLWRIGEADVQLVALVEITMIRGEAQRFELHLPAGFEPSSVTGSSLETSETKANVLTLAVRDAAQRRHQFLVSAERAHDAGPFKLDAALASVPQAQRETGEVALEGGGTIEVNASGGEALRRMDVREVHASLRALSQEPLLAAFRYQRRPGETRTLALDVKRFPDAPVIAAVADHATVTSLLTTEGRMLTEIALRLRNRAQPFVKVTLPPGASMLSVEVAGESARPVQGSDGMRVPLLRPGFKPIGPYDVSFVYLSSGAPFEKRGDARLALAAIDLPISMLDWELFVPDRYRVKAVGGNVIPGPAFGPDRRASLPVAPQYGGGTGGGTFGVSRRMGGALRERVAAAPGEIAGRIVDSNGYILPGVTVTLISGGTRRSATTGADGTYVLYDVPPGRATITTELHGFKTSQQSIIYNREPISVDFVMQISALNETVTVAAEAPRGAAKAEAEPEPQQASQNVVNLQRRVAGVLPVRIDVPRTGTSHTFVRPLVLGEVTEVALQYKRR